jgi:hypothetical protein
MYYGRLMMSGQNEIYERIIDLSIKVVQGKLDPLDVDIGRYLKLLKEKELDISNVSELYMDIYALNGLVLILEAQYKRLKSGGLGLYIEPLLVKLKAKQLSLESISRIFIKCWHPSISIQISTTESIIEAINYYNQLKPINERRFKIDAAPIVSATSIPSLILPSELEDMMEKLLKELWKESGGDWIEYYTFISKGGDKVERAYILSFIITSGWAELKLRRFEDKILIRPIKSVAQPDDVYSVATELKGDTQ